MLLVLLGTDFQQVTSSTIVLVVLPVVPGTIPHLECTSGVIGGTDTCRENAFLPEKGLHFSEKRLHSPEKGLHFSEERLTLFEKGVPFCVADLVQQQLSLLLWSREAFPVGKRPASVAAPAVVPVVVCYTIYKCLIIRV